MSAFFLKLDEPRVSQIPGLPGSSPVRGLLCAYSRCPFTARPTDGKGEQSRFFVFILTLIITHSRSHFKTPGSPLKPGLLT
jgi:hypothetical protein